MAKAHPVLALPAARHDPEAIRTASTLTTPLLRARRATEHSAPRFHTADWVKGLESLRGAFANSTIDSYTRDFERFSAWCETRDVAALPTSPETLVAYLKDSVKRYTAATLVRDMAAIVRVHNVLELPNPAAHETVRIAMRRVRRVRPTRPKQAYGITRPLRDRLLQACSNDLSGKRDRAMIAVGFEGLCRRSELVKLTVGDLAHNRHGQLAVTVRRGKADQEGMGRVVALSPATAAIVQDWIDAAELTRGPLLRPVYHSKVLSRFLNGYTICRRLKTIAKTAGLSDDIVDNISGHSLRVGAAQTLLDDGFDVLRLMKVGGWRSATTVFRYIERAEVNVWA